jgi:NAD(P)-dependent dehydrogenase (short-subunit alcohol dehydrogenase family)
MRLEGQVAIVTGGGSGLGRASARALARDGATVVVGDLDADGAQETVDAINGADGVAHFVPVDVGEHEQCRVLVDTAVERFGSLDVLHANAGIALPFADGFTAAVDPEVWDRVIRVNLSGVFYCCHYAIPAMAKGGGGSIITTGSSMSTLPLGALDAYAASKGGVALLTRSMAAQAGALGIRVNAICPGYVDTPLNAAITSSDELRDAFAEAHATGFQSPDEIAEVVAFLASDDSVAFTGAVLTCDRGWTAFKSPPMIHAAQQAMTRAGAAGDAG